MSEEQRAQSERIITEANGLSAEKREVALAYIQGMTAATKLMQREQEKSA